MRLRNLIPTSTKLNLIYSIELTVTLSGIFCCASDRRKLERIQEGALGAHYVLLDVLYVFLSCTSYALFSYNLYFYIVNIFVSPFSGFVTTAILA